MVESLRPLWGNVCLKLDDPDEKTEGGLWIPEPAREMKLSGTVMAAGSGRIDVNGVFHPTNLKPGDKVMFGRHLGYKVPVEGEKFYMCMEKYIEAVVGEPDELALLDAPAADVHWEYMTVDIPNWQQELGEVAFYTSQQWIPHAVVKGTNTLRQFRRDAVKYWQEYHRERAVMNEVSNDPKLEDMAIVNPLHPVMEIDHVSIGVSQDIPNYEYKVINITCYKSEPDSPEAKELERYQSQGWEIHEASMNADCLRVTSLRRIVK